MKKAAVLAAFLLIFGTRAASAQVVVIDTVLTPEAAASVVAFYNNDATTRLSGDARIAAGTRMERGVAVLDGSLTLAGRIDGDLVIIHGNLIAEPGAEVSGSVTVVGGAVDGIEHLRARVVTLHHERLRYELRDGVLLLLRELQADALSAGHDFGFGRTDIVVAARGGYNRSEGLPVHIGPRLTLERRNPTRLEALYIFRSAAGFDFDQDDYGYVLTAEQYVGGKRTARVGFRYASEVLPIEQWGLSDRETSLATFLLHRDYRDHYNRDGWSVYLAAGRPGLPFEWRIAFANYEYQTAVLRDPWTIKDRDEAWRREPFVPDVRLRTLEFDSRYDTRNDRRDPSTGWLVFADLDAGLSLRSGEPAGFDADYRYGRIDVRRYARLSPYSRIALRAVAAGSINGNALPVWRQQALGGEGSLPGYELYEFDCGGHHVRGFSASPHYGCDQLMLLQTEYQANLRWLSYLGRNVGRDFGLLDNIKWVLFFDAGRAWTSADAAGMRGRGTPDFAADAGFGLRFGALGAYWAVPLSERASGLNFFVRIGPRF